MGTRSGCNKEKVCAASEQHGPHRCGNAHIAVLMPSSGGGQTRKEKERNRLAHRTIQHPPSLVQLELAWPEKLPILHAPIEVAARHLLPRT